MDVDINDDRARKVLGYRNRYSTAQTLRWIVETIEASDKSEAEKIAEANNKPSNEALPMLNGLVEVLKNE